MKTATLWIIGAAVLLGQPPQYVPVRTLTGHTRLVSSVVFTPDGKRLATGSWDGTVRLWQVDTGERLLTLNAHELPITAIDISPDGRLLATASDDCTVKLWDMSTRRLRHTFRHNSYAMSVAFNPDGRRLASASAFGAIRIWDVERAKPVEMLEAHETAVQSIAFSPDGRYLASAGRKDPIRIWDTATWKLAAEYEGIRNPRFVVFSADSRTVAAANPSQIRLTDVATGKHSPFIVTETMQPHMIAAAFSPDGRWIAVGGGPGFVELWDTATQKRLTTLSGQIGGSAAKCAATATCAVESIAITRDGVWLAAGGDDDTVKLWRRQ